MPSARPVRVQARRGGREPVRILAIDGGGMRGLVPARILESLERRTGKPTCSLFDLVAGTSTGGIIALALTVPAADGSGPRWSAADLVELYRAKGPEIFRVGLEHLVASGGGWWGPKYSSEAIERVLLHYLGNARLSDALAPVLVTSYDTAAASPYLFKSYRQPSPGTPAGQLPDDFPMWQAARATSAAPTYFPPFLLRPLEAAKQDRSLVDGGVFANNPAMCALADAYKMFGGSASSYLVVSIGTGKDELRLGHGQVKGRGKLRWAIPILKIVFDGVSDVVDYQAEEMADAYWRFQEDASLGALDDASPEAVKRLLAAADALIARRERDLAGLADVLARPRASLAGYGPGA